MTWYKQSKTEHLNKKHISKLYDGTNIYMVEGGYVRDNYDVDFVYGGHHLAYDFIPENEIWIERHDTDKHDTLAIMAHEIIEYLDMKYKHEPYAKAHKKALEGEKEVRKETPI
jgi:hypothetical protein